MVLESKKALKKQGDGACQGDTGPKLKELSMAKTGQSSDSCSVMSDSATPWAAARQASLSITNSQSLPKLMSIELMYHLILCYPLFLPPSTSPPSGSFQMTQFFVSGGQSIGVSASTSVLPINIQD